MAPGFVGKQLNFHIYPLSINAGVQWHSFNKQIKVKKTLCSQQISELHCNLSALIK